MSAIQASCSVTSAWRGESGRDGEAVETVLWDDGVSPATHLLPRRSFSNQKRQWFYQEKEEENTGGGQEAHGMSESTPSGWGERTGGWTPRSFWPKAGSAAQEGGQWQKDPGSRLAGRRGMHMIQTSVYWLRPPHHPRQPCEARGRIPIKWSKTLSLRKAK